MHFLFIKSKKKLQKNKVTLYKDNPRPQEWQYIKMSILQKGDNEDISNSSKEINQKVWREYFNFCYAGQFKCD